MGPLRRPIKIGPAELELIRSKGLPPEWEDAQLEVNPEDLTAEERERSLATDKPKPLDIWPRRS